MQLKTLLVILILGVSALFIGLAATGQFAQTESSAVSANPAASADSLTITVYRSPTCGCCKAWIDHLKINGFHVEDNVTADVGAKKDKLGLPAQLTSCHTAVVNGYVIEGHVPANDIKQLLKQKPTIAGLAVPGMPAGSPGMETAGQHDPFDVIAFDKSGEINTFSHYPAR